MPFVLYPPLASAFFCRKRKNPNFSLTRKPRCTVAPAEMASYRSGRLVLCFVLLMVMQRVGSFMLKPLHRNGAFAGRALFSSTAATTPTTTTTQSLDPVSDTRAKETFNQVFASDKRPVILFDVSGPKFQCK